MTIVNMKQRLENLLMKLSRLFRQRPHEEAASQLYSAVATQSRQPAFYANCGVPDTMEGRFDMVSLHAFLVMRRLKQDRGQALVLAQELFDIMFEDMDASLRESGVSDLAIGGQVKKLAMAFYGRVAAYDAGLNQTGNDQVLTNALERNLFRAVHSAENAVASMAKYMRSEASSLEKQPIDSLMAGRVIFGPAPSGASATEDSE